MPKTDGAASAGAAQAARYQTDSCKLVSRKKNEKSISELLIIDDAPEWDADNLHTADTIRVTDWN
jgi:hypothetical protein